MDLLLNNSASVPDSNDRPNIIIKPFLPFLVAIHPESSKEIIGLTFDTFDIQNCFDSEQAILRLYGIVAGICSGSGKNFEKS